MTRSSLSLELTSDELNILLKYFPHGITAIDLEMTGLSTGIDKIIELAAIKVNADKSVETFHTLVNPLIPIPADTVEYHGLTDAMVQDAPTIKKAIKEFANHLSHIPIIGHSVQFDASFVVHDYHLQNLDFGPNHFYDSCRFARAVFKRREKKPQNFKLSGLAEYFKINFSHHQALDDALTSLKVYAQCLLLNESAEDQLNYKDASYLFRLRDFKKVNDFVLPKKFEVLREKMVKREIIQMKYKGGNHGDDWREVRPIAILNTPRGIVLYGECQISKLNKTFAIKKIKKVKGLIE
jgi:DNA polymerase-3 subunit epsilon